MVPVVYSTPGVTVSTFSRWATAKMRCDGLFSAASMARNVAGRPAPIGVDTPGNNTTSRSGSTGSVSLSDMGIDLCVRVLSLHMSRAVDSIVHAKQKRRTEHARSIARRSIRQTLPNSHPLGALYRRLGAASPVSQARLAGCTPALRGLIYPRALHANWDERSRQGTRGPPGTGARQRLYPRRGNRPGRDGRGLQRPRRAAEEARRIMLETADALGAAHALGIIHRDVKPDNILLEGSRGRVVVTDFGIAKALSSTTGSATLTATGVAIGTPHYMSPEQAAGDREIDGRSDIYSLGVVSYQMLTGELPFQAPTVPGILMKHITERAPLVTEKCVDCPDDLAACVMRSLEKDPDDRWP